MGGGPVYAMNQFVWGVDLIEEQFLASCGIPSRPYMSKVRLRFQEVSVPTRGKNA